MDKTAKRVIKKIAKQIPKLNDFDKGVLIGRVEEMANKPKPEEKGDGNEYNGI